MDNPNDVVRLRQVKWKTNLSRQVNEFSEIIKDDEVFEKYFGGKYVERLTDKSKAITRTLIKLGVVYAVLMLSLFASQNIGESEFEVFGYGFKNLGYYKEFLLLLAAAISPVSAILSAYQQYLTALIKECLKKIAPNASIRQFYSHLYLDEYFEGLISKKSGASITPHGFAVLLIAIFLITILFLFFTLLAGSFFIQISVIYDVATKPASSHYLNLFVVIFAIASILLSWLVSIMQFPMPEVDLSNYSKIFELEKQEPEKYKETMRKLSRESAKKEALSTIVLSVIVYIVGFAGIALYWFSGSFDNLSNFLGKAMPGSFIVMFLSSELAWYLKKRSMSWFFQKYPDKSDQRLRAFKRLGRILFLAKIVAPLCLSVGYAIYALSAS